MPSRLIAFLALVVFAAGSAVAAAPPLPPSNWTDGYVIANGIRIHYWRTGGEKPAIVLAHGSSDDGLCWTNFAKELERDYDIIMWDARGHGLSDPPRPADEPDVMVDDLAGLIRELKLVNPIVMGHSMGSATAAWFGAKYPDVARAIVLEDPGLVRRPPTPNAAPDVEKRRAGILARNNTSYEQLVNECMKSSPKWGASECEIWAPSKRRHHPDTALVSIGSRPPMRDLFPKITAPVLILKADAQGDLRRENEEVAGLLKKGRIVHIEGAAHNVRRDQKQKTLSVLKEFLAGL
ncbi:MAG TPA: alpha/beta hydrolase [Bryobacteraceae bacterium]|nr:alpha/beta hydrolase [Bryobacteraceae bacterium]